MADEESKDQELSKEFASALSGAPEKAAAAIDPCLIYRLIPQALKKKLGDWIESKLGKPARHFYDTLIAIADKFCGAREKSA
jgi:hypothetical protein